MLGYLHVLAVVEDSLVPCMMPCLDCNIRVENLVRIRLGWERICSGLKLVLIEEAVKAAVFFLQVQVLV